MKLGNVSSVNPGGGEDTMAKLISQIIEVASSEVVFAILFISLGVWLFWFGTKHFMELKKEQSKRENDLLTENDRREQKLIDIYEQQSQRAEDRESQLMGYLDKNNEQLGTIARTLEKVENRMDDNFIAIWKELGQKQNKQNQKGE